MLQNFNWIDIIIAIFLSISLIQGIRTGLIRSVFTIVGIAAGLAIAIVYYVDGSRLILDLINLPRFIADSVSFIILFSVTAVLIHILGFFVALVTRFSPLRLIDKIGGGGVGLVIGFAVVGVFLLLLIAFPVFPGIQDYVEQSSLAPYLVDHTELIMGMVSDFLPVDLPRLTIHPEDLAGYFNNAAVVESEARYHDIDFAALDGAACFVCGGPVEFQGFLNNDKGSYSPKFVCTDCGRTSDGCQTFEGYHQMYNKCPVELGNQGYRFDCGIWTNHSYHRPGGPCPVCGAE